MRAGDREGVGLGADRRQHARSGEDRHTGLAGLVEFDVVSRDGGRSRDGVDAVHQGAIVTDVYLHAGGANTFEDGMLPKV